MGKEVYYQIYFRLQGVIDVNYFVLNKVDISTPLSWKKLERQIRDDNHLDDTTELWHTEDNGHFKNIKGLTDPPGTEKIFLIYAIPENEKDNGQWCYGNDMVRKVLERSRQI
eukprot:GHVU01072929.1.p1 GENE.GHVU01072929.1~~GHVU01072929.1.p1  ORF type:complete len:131 (+),score=21.55 GHVU01072929.1:58-393(+)